MSELFERRRVTHREGGEQVTKESHALETDIPTIVRRYKAAGIPLPEVPPRYGDFSTGQDFHAALSRVRDAELEFMQLPSSVRRVCDNDPGRFLSMFGTEDGRELLAAAGLPPELRPGAETTPSEPSSAEPAAQPAEPSEPIISEKG